MLPQIDHAANHRRECIVLAGPSAGRYMMRLSKQERDLIEIQEMAERDREAKARKKKRKAA